jgi:hypothetical protein
MIKTLQPAYNLPTRQILSGTLLQAELARVNLRIYNELAKKTNCTIGKFHYYFFINILILILFLLFVIYSKIHMIILSALDHTAELSLKIIHQFSIYGALRTALI